MMKRKELRSLKVVILFFFLILFEAASASGCTIVAVGKDASSDGSVINSHTADGWFYDSNITIIRGGKFEKNARVPVFLNLLGDEGTPYKVRDIPQVKETNTYFRTGYSCFNEHQLSISESTIGQKDELKTFVYDKGPIMTVEQLEIFALQRTDTARDAIAVIGELAEKYGFLPSCNSQGESLVITDPLEVWVMEIFSVGLNWDQDSESEGAIWAARRVPEDEVVIVANSSRIQEIDISRPDWFLASSNYMEHAIKMGWFDPSEGENFSWQKTYSPRTGYWSLASMWQRERLHYIHKTLSSSSKWDPFAEIQSYPFSFRPDEKVSVKDVMGILRSPLEDTPFDMEDNSAWIVQDVNGNSVRSELATPFPDRATRKLLNIPYHRPVAAKSSYTFVSQSRSWLPDWIGGVLWFAPGRPHISCYVPVYAGTAEIPESWKNYDPDKFSLDSARWSITLADELVNRRFQVAIQDLKRVREPLERDFFEDQEKVETKALELYERSPERSREYLSSYVTDCMKKVERSYWQLCFSLIPKYTSNKCW